MAINLTNDQLNLKKKTNTIIVQNETYKRKAETIYIQKYSIQVRQLP